MVSKKAALEMSIGTIVIIVLAMTLLILGMVLIRKVMCSGIVITDQIERGLENEIKGLFSVDDYGIKCLGEEGEEAKLGDGGRRQVFCVIKTDESKEYSLRVESVESLGGVSTGNVKNWIKDEDWNGKVSSGEKTVTVLLLDVPKNVDATTLKIKVKETDVEANTENTHILYIDVVHVGRFTTAVC